MRMNAGRSVQDGGLKQQKWSFTEGRWRYRDIHVSKDKVLVKIEAKRKQITSGRDR